MPRLSALIALTCALGAGPLGVGPLHAASAPRQPADVAGTWELGFDKTGSACRVLLRAEKSDKGDYFLGMPTACRHSMPGIAAVGRWSMPDGGHVVLGDPGGVMLLTLEEQRDGFAFAGPVGTYTLKPLAIGRSAVTAGLEPAAASTTVEAPAVADRPAVLERVASRRARAENAGPVEAVSDVAGRYAVMREKRDTGCMITLDKARASGGDRAQLAPGCRDQGIVIFDPSSWALVKGGLVLTARAGHKTRLDREAEGVWSKDPKEGGKPLGLKKL